MQCELFVQACCFRSYFANQSSCRLVCLQVPTDFSFCTTLSACTDGTAVPREKGSALDEFPTDKRRDGITAVVSNELRVEYKARRAEFCLLIGLSSPDTGEFGSTRGADESKDGFALPDTFVGKPFLEARGPFAHRGLDAMRTLGFAERRVIFRGLGVSTRPCPSKSYPDTRERSR